MSEFWILYWSVCVFLVGLCFGSFLNVCIYRIPKEISLVRPPSACPACKTLIKWYDNVPVFGWLFLGGKCRACRAPISVGYPLVELLFGLICLGFWLLYGVGFAQPFVAVCYSLVAFGLLLGTFVDLAEMWLPDRVTIGGMVVGPLLSALVPALHGAQNWQGGLTASLVGLGAGFGLFWIVRELGTAVFKKEAMGFGDVKLMGAIGALLGWQAVLFTVFFSALFGGVIGVAMIAAHRQELGSRIPYGPYIALAALAWMFGGFRLWGAYIAFLGL
jgi:leader peptidase (prepilin peptidase)/N-methyltransferase